MKWIGKILGYILLGINLLTGISLLLSAYSPHFDPQAHPTWSCLGLFFPIFLMLNLIFLCFWTIVYWRYTLLPIFFLVACWGSIHTYYPINWFNEDAPKDAIKILSYNTRAFSLKAQHTKEKSNEVLAYLQNCNADIICLQEYIWGKKLKKRDIDYALRDYRYKHYQPLGRKGLNGLGIYSRYPILSATPIKYNSNRNGSIAYRIKVGKDTLLVINNHLESNKIDEKDVEIMDTPNSKRLYHRAWKTLQKIASATSIRATQADILLDSVKKAKEKYVILCGDFNDTPISYTHHILHNKLNDAFMESGNGMGISYNMHHLYVRIDHILTSKNLKVYDCTVDNTTNASDHYPIWCHISLGEEGK